MMRRTPGGARRRAIATAPALEPLEGRRMLSGPGTGDVGPPASPIVSLIEFDRASTRTVPESAGTVSFLVKRTGDLSSGATVRARTVAVTALEGYDYAPLETTLTFAPGQSTATFAVTIVNDAVAEAPYKSFRVVLEGPSAGAGLAQNSIAPVTILDDEPDSKLPLTLLDFGPHGVWTHAPYGGFRKIHGGGAQAIAASSNRIAYLDLGIDGLWAWDSLRGLRRLHEGDPQNVVIVNDDWNHAEDVLLVDFGPSGLWRFSEGRGWDRLSHVDPRAIVVDRLDAYIDFGHGGLWRYRDASPSWYKLNDVAPQSMAADGVLFLDYGARGIWSWAASQGWRKVGEADPQAIAASGTTLYADFGVDGVWSRTEADGWSQITAADPRSMRAAGGTLFLDFGVDGLWSWRAGPTPASRFTRLTDAAVESFAVGPAGDRVVVDAGAAGVWVWTRDGYRRLNAANPTAIAVTA